MKVCIISIIGPLRTGKSFALNLIAQHFKKGSFNKTKKLEKYFEWKNGFKPDTIGMWTLENPIIIKHPQTKEDIAVLLIDVHCIFDTNLNPRMNTMLFSFSTLISSILI